MLSVISNENFSAVRRDTLLDYNKYVQEANDLTRRITLVGANMANPELMATKDAAAKMRMSFGRATYTIDLLTLSYAAGVAITELRANYPSVLHAWEDAARYDRDFDLTPGRAGSDVATFPLQGDTFDMVNRMVCFGILLGWGNLLPRIADLIEYNNPKRDGMLERIFSFYISDRGALPDECTRHLPYFKTLKIFAAPHSERNALMTEYLEDWYQASRREPYYESHKSPVSFRGYKSYEAAAISFLLKIDDSNYSDSIFYPDDLVDFAQKIYSELEQAGVEGPSALELRSKAGERCPLAGVWESIGLPSQSKNFEVGQEMDALGTSYGLTVWRYKDASRLVPVR